MKRFITIMIIYNLCFVFCMRIYAEELDWNKIAVLCVLEKEIVYSTYDTDGGTTKFYIHDMDDNESTMVGMIDSEYIMSGDITYLNDCIYFWISVENKDSGNVNSFVTILYCIDLVNVQLKRICECEVYQPLVYVESGDGKLLSYFGRVERGQGICSISEIELEESADMVLREYISKEYFQVDGVGEFIEQFTVDDKYIYVYVTSYGIEHNNSYIEIYDIDGKYVNKIIFDEKLSDLLSDEKVLLLKKYDNYFFIKTWNQSGVIFSIEQVVAKCVFSWDYYAGIDIAESIDKNNAKQVILYSRNFGRIWKWNIAEEILLELDLECDGIRYIFMNMSGEEFLSCVYESNGECKYAWECIDNITVLNKYALR